jgi:dUTP pyrophosphatase
MKVKIKKLHPNAVIPHYAKIGDAGLDLTAIGFETTDTHITYHTGLAIEIPYGYVGLLFPRSSVYKTEQVLSNSVGVIDSGYRGEVMLKFSRSKKEYIIGDRIGQIMLLKYPQIDFEEVDQLTSTSRDKGGFGSTGN